MITDYNLFLDDVRIPTQVTWAAIPKDQHYSVVRSYKEFVDLITLRREVPKYVCYDHDLAMAMYIIGEIPYNSYDEKTGYDCAKWLCEYCWTNGLPVPTWNVHSANPVGRDNIVSILQNFEKKLNY